ncbi:MAG: hypothetical protein QM758_06790 [Armatimonas sp.]
MSVSVSTLVQLTRRRLHEANNSPVGEMASGTTGGPTVSGESGIIEALNRVASEICRTCFYYEATGSVSSGMRTIPLSMLGSVTPGGATLWGPLYVAKEAGLAPLQHLGRGVLPIASMLSAATGVPRYWLEAGEGTLELYPPPSSSLTITMRGAAVPPALVSGGPDVSFLPDELLQKLLPAGAASRLAMAEADNPAIAARGPLWQAEYDLERVRLWERTPLLIRNRLYPTPPGGMA